MYSTSSVYVEASEIGTLTAPERRNGLGESPMWSGCDRAMYWVDIEASEIHRFNVELQEHEVRSVEEPVSAVCNAANDHLSVVSRDAVHDCRFDNPRFDSSVSIPYVPEGGRLNDAKPDHAGRFWLGSMCSDSSVAPGRLYSLSPDNFVSVVTSERFEVANGLAWSPDNKTMYVVETNRRKIMSYDFDLVTGAVSNGGVFIDMSSESSKPDGIATDAVGNLWCAMWDGWSLRRFRPDGRLDRIVEMPVPRPTSVAFGGVNMQTVFVTSASKGLSETQLALAPASGCLFSFHSDVPGQPVGVFRRPLRAER